MSSAAGNYVTSYDTGNKPFKHDVTRGKWSSNSDFNLACITHAFGVVNFSFLPIYIMMSNGALFMIPYILCAILFVLPIFFIQTFLGQFSSTGFISVFRISPLFKGVAYVIVALNIVAACINAIGASYALVYFFASFSPTLPWMSCNHSWNDPNCTTVFKNATTIYGMYDYSWSTMEYFLTGVLNFSDDHFDKLRIAWPVFGASIVTWLIVGFVFYKGIQSITQFLRFSAIAIIAILVLIFVRIACLPDSINGLQDFLFSNFGETYIETWIGSPLIAVSHFGTGWGVVLTMASHNNFKANIYKNALVVTLSLICLETIATLTVFLAHEYLKVHLNFEVIYMQSSAFQSLFLDFPHLFGNIEASNMWSLLFFLMLALCELNAVVVILFATMTSLFDEYEYLRIYKKQISIILPAALFLLSIVFTTDFGFEICSLTLRLCGASQMGICFLELMIVVWVYGRQRFQRDVQFMVGHTIATWQFYLVRFVTPLFILFLLLIFIAWSSIVEGFHTNILATIIVGTLKFIPWLFIPAYVAIQLIRTSGKLSARFKRCIRPNDWYPADAADRQRYEDTFGNADISHQLVQSNFNEED